MLDLDKISKGISPRIMVFLALTALAFLILLIRLFQVQVLDQKTFQDAIDSQVIRKVRLSAIRGKIYSSDGVIIADTMPSYDIELYPNEFRQPSLNSTLTTRNSIVDEISSYSEIIHHPSLLNKSELWNQIYNKSQSQLPVFKSLTYQQIKELKKIPLAKHYLIKNNTLTIDTSKITILPAVSGSKRTVQNIKDNIEEIGRIINRKSKHTTQQITRHIRLYPALPIIAFKNLNEKELALAYEHIPHIKSKKNQRGIDIRVSSRRHYPHPYTAPHLLGYTARKDPQTEEDFQNYDYFRPEQIGREGLEKHFDIFLRGQGGIKTSTVNISGYQQGKRAQNEDAVNYSPDDLAPEHGQNVTLTLDFKAQTIANKLLRGKVGALVALDLKTGAIKAMASAPTFDINRRNSLKYYKEISQRDKLTHPLLWPMPIRNRALNASYFPGSTVKPLIALAALKYNKLDPTEIFYCDRHYELTSKPHPRIHCHSYHGEISMFEALERSCNPYFIKQGLQIGVDKISEVYDSAGIGSYPLNFAKLSWNKGTLPSRQQKGPKWIYSDTAYISIGQGRITTSPLQVALFTAGLANKGPIMKPYILEKVTDSLNKETIERTQPQLWRTIDSPKEHFEMVQQGMFQVVHGEKPSAKVAQIKLFDIAGKTGTAQKPYYTYKRDLEGNFIYAKDEKGNFLYSKDEKGKILYLKGKDGKLHKKKVRIIDEKKKLLYTWFTCYAPADDPQYVVTVMIENGKSGGGTCAPIATKFFQEWFTAQ